MNNQTKPSATGQAAQHTPGPWSYSYYSAAQARAEEPGSDGGGADGFIQKCPHALAFPQNIAFMPHNRDLAKDAEVEANARLMAAAPDLPALSTLKLHLRKSRASDCISATKFETDGQPIKIVDMGRGHGVVFAD